MPVTSYECTSLLTSGSGDGENINNKKTSAEEWKPSTAGSTLLTVLQLIVMMVSPPTLMTNVGDVYEVMCSGGDEMETSCERSINLLSRVGCCFALFALTVLAVINAALCTTFSHRRTRVVRLYDGGSGSTANSRRR